MAADHFPDYAGLSGRTGAPPGSSWGVFAEDPERGMANFAGVDRVLAGAAAVRSGIVVGLDYPIAAFDPSMSRNRTPPAQTITAAHADSFDDVWNGFWPQAGSHLDGLRHRRAHGHGFYNGIPDAAVAPRSGALGVQRWAEKPIVGRAVLLDIERWRRSTGAPVDHVRGEALELDDLHSTARAQGTTMEAGDILLLHTGWAEWFLGLDEHGRKAAKARRRTTGVRQSHDFLAWLWDSRIALLGTDTFAVEVLPAVPDSPFDQTAPDDAGMMHQELIAKLGCPLGELWRLNELAGECARLGRYEFLVTVKPLNLLGAVGSPCNATAIL